MATRTRAAAVPRVTFWGATRMVTGSMHLVEVGDTRLLLDCGLVADEGDVFAVTAGQLETCPFFMVKQGTLSANATRLLANLEQARTRPLWRILVLSQVANGIWLPIVLIFMILLVNRRDLMGSQVDVVFDTLPATQGFIKGGRLRALAVTTAQRVPSIADIPTTAEAGLSMSMS